MDRDHKQALAALLGELDAAVIVATHDPEFAAAFADRVILLADGAPIADAGIAEVLAGGSYFATETARILGGAGGALTPADGAELITAAPAPRRRCSGELAAGGLRAAGPGAGGGFAWYERQRPDARIVALVGTLSAFAALGRIAFAAVPNVKPTTDIVLIAGYALGGGPGFAVGALAGLTSNFFFGQGPWTPWQMAAWGATGIIGAGLARLVERASLPARRGAARGPRRSAAGRWRSSAASWASLHRRSRMSATGSPTAITAAGHSAAYVGQGLGFDAIHAAGCLMFALALGPGADPLDPAVRPPAAGAVAPGRQPGARSHGGAGSLIVLTLVIALTTALGADRRRSRGRGRLAGHRPRGRGRPTCSGPRTPTADSARRPASRRTSCLPAGRRSGWRRPAAISTTVAARRRTDGLRHAPAPVRRRTSDRWNGRSWSSTPPGCLRASFAGHDLVAELERHLRRDGSVSDQVNLTAFAILALRAGGIDAQLTDGALAGGASRITTAASASPGAGGSSDVDDTGATLEALAGDGGDPGGERPRGGVPASSAGSRWRLPLPAGRRFKRAVDRLGDPGTRRDRRRAGRRPRCRRPVPDRLPGLAGRRRTDRSGYSRGLTQTPVWVTGEALMALEGNPLPVAAPPPAAPAERAPAASGRPAGTAQRSARHATRRGTRRRRAATARSPAPGRGSGRAVRDPRPAPEAPDSGVRIRAWRTPWASSPRSFWLPSGSADRARSASPDPLSAAHTVLCTAACGSESRRRQLTASAGSRWCLRSWAS